MDNKGFTLVEIIVAVILSTFATLGVVLILRMSFSNFKSTEFQAQVQIESQQITDSLRNSLQGCDEYKTFVIDGNKIIEVHTYDSNVEKYVYYNYLIYDEKCYLQVTDESISDRSSISINDFYYLANYLKGITLTPDDYDKTNGLKNYQCTVEIEMDAYDLPYTSSFIVYIRSSN